VSLHLAANRFAESNAVSDGEPLSDYIARMVNTHLDRWDPNLAATKRELYCERGYRDAAVQTARSWCPWPGKMGQRAADIVPFYTLAEPE